MRSTIIIYRLFDAAEEINLEIAQALWSNRNKLASRLRFERIHSKSITFKDPPVVVELGSHEMEIANASYLVEASAKIYDYGVISINIAIDVPEEATYEEYLELAIASDNIPEDTILDFAKGILETIKPACSKPCLSKYIEDFVVFYFKDPIPDWDLAPILLKEKLYINDQIKEETLSNRFSYGKDITYITWESAIVYDPSDSMDIPDLLEFGSAQFLELRYYDNLLNEAIDVNYDEIENIEGLNKQKRHKTYNEVRGRIMERMADVSMLTSNIINSLQLTEDTFYARVYSSYMQLQKTGIWRKSIDKKLDVLQRSYHLLNEEVVLNRKETIGITALTLLTLILILNIYIAFIK